MAAYPLSDIQSQDPMLKRVKKWLTTGNPPPAEDGDLLADAQLRRYHCWYSDLRLHDGVVYLKEGENYRTCVPEILIPDVLRLLH